MPGLGLANPPAIRTPGVGPNGPGPIDMRHAIADVGSGSVPYGPTNGYATPNGVTGYIGPAAGSLRQPSTWYVRATGSNNNGGTSSGTAADRTGTDGSTTSGSLTFTSASAAFTVADVGKGICIQNATFCYAKIVSLNSATSVQLSNPPSATAGSLSWSIGGAWASPAPVLNSNVFANTTCGVQSGDTVYVGAGTYRIVEAVGANFGAAWNATGGTVLRAADNFNGQASIVGDVTGQYTGDAGMVQLTAYTTNDKTAPSATTLLNLNGKSNLAFSNIMFVTGSATLLTATTATSQNMTFTDCALVIGATGTSAVLSATAAYSVPLAWVFDRCVIDAYTSAAALTFTLTTGGPSDFDANVLLRNCFLPNSPATLISVTNSGTLTGKGGGVRVRNCSIVGRATAMLTAASQISTVFPCSVTNSFLLMTTGVVLSAGTTGQIVESNNLIVSGNPRTNVNIGSGSISDGSYSPLFHFGQERIWGGLLRAFGEPMSGSPLLGFGNDGAQTLYDLMNRPRPAGGGSGFPLPAVGALERSNTAAQATSPVPPAGTHDWQFTGPGYQDFLLPVSNAATTVAISVQRDSAYAAPPGATLPAMLILANGTLGVTAQTITDTGASGGWNTLTSAAFTPSGTGWVTVRIVSYDGSGTSVVSFSNVSVT